MSPIPLGIWATAGAGGGSATGIELIQTITSSSTSVTFSNIPTTTYKHLRLHITGKYTNGFENTAKMTFNGSSSSDYAFHHLWAKASLTSVYGEGASSQSSMEICKALFGGSGVPTPIIMDIPDAFNTTKYKVFQSISGTINTSSNSETYISQSSGLWQSTSAITSITFSSVYNFSSARFSLYGIGG